MSELKIWTRFMDMHSGGGLKESPHQYIYIEAPEDEAKRIFYGRFGHNPERVTCTCCGEDYSISSDESLTQLTGHDRNCDYDGEYVERQNPRNMDIRRQCNTADSEPWGLYQPLTEYVKRDDVLMISAGEIKPEWRNADVPEQGYVWV